MLKRMLLMLIVLLTAASLAEAETPEAFTGYFEKNVFIRPEPKGSDVSLGHIPANTPVLLTPVDGRYAAVTWQGTTGYVYCAEVKRLPEETAVAPYLAYLPENKYLFALPLDGAQAVATVQAETPVTVIAEVGRFLRVQDGPQEGYVYARDARAVADIAMKSSDAEFYASQPVQALEHPLKRAQAALTLESSRVYIAEAVGGGYFRVTIGGKTVYVNMQHVTVVNRGQESVRAAIITADTQLYDAPSPDAQTDARMPETALAPLEKQVNGFQRIRGTEWFVRPNDVIVYALAPTGGQQLLFTDDAQLRLAPDAQASAVAAIPAGMLCAAPYATEDWYLLQAEGQWGFLRRDDEAASPLPAGEAMMRTAAVTTQAAAFSASDGRQVMLAAGARLTLTGLSEDFFWCEAAEGTGCIRRAEVRILGSDTELTAYSVTAPEAVRVIDFPDAALAREAFVIPAGARLRVTGFNRCYLMVEYGGKTGYAPQQGLVTKESAGLPETEEIPRCTLVLDKSTGMCYVFLLTETGERGELVICAEVGIGKRTTPTPTGTYLLGWKERWHTFSHSYTPHTTEYVKARYIHGWPCEQKSEAAVKTGLAHAGAVTGGCLRSPFEFARWVYMNCGSYVTEITIVGGGFEAPANAAERQVK